LYKRSIFDLDLFLGTDRREIIYSPFSTASVSTDFAFFYFGLIALLEQIGGALLSGLKLYPLNHVCQNFNFADYGIYNVNTGLKHLQTPLNVLAQLLARTNATIALSIALNIIALLISPFIPRSSLYSSTTFPYLRWPLLLKI